MKTKTPKSVMKWGAISVCLLFPLVKPLPSRRKLPPTHQSPQAARELRARKPAKQAVSWEGLGFRQEQVPTSPQLKVGLPCPPSPCGPALDDGW